MKVCRCRQCLGTMCRNTHLLRHGILLGFDCRKSELTGWRLHLAVSDLSDWLSCEGIEISMYSVCGCRLTLHRWRRPSWSQYWEHCKLTGRSLYLAVANLCCLSTLSSTSWLTIWLSADLTTSAGSTTTAAWLDLKSDWVALSTDRLIVQVVESTRQALVESGVTTDGTKGAIGASWPSTREDGSGLWWWAVELELTVGNNGTDTSGAVDELTVVEGQGESTWAIAGGLSLQDLISKEHFIMKSDTYSLDWSLASGGDVDSGNLEASSVRWCTCSCSGGLRSWSSESNGCESSDSECGVHVDNYVVNYSDCCVIVMELLWATVMSIDIRWGCSIASEWQLCCFDEDDMILQTQMVQGL